jgi:signal transduction histidine kinase
MEAQEQERSRLARELHDGVCQEMTALAFRLRRLGKNIPESAKDARRQEQELQDDIASLSTHVSAIAHRLHSSKLDLLGLAAAARAFCQEVSSHHGVAVEFTDDNVPDTLPPVVTLNLFRVLQEALANAAKHSGTPRCQVLLRATNDELQLEVRDEGKGFDHEAALASAGLGLVSMRERLKLMNGSLAIDSTPGAGTTVRATVPLASQGVLPSVVQVFRSRAAS